MKIIIALILLVLVAVTLALGQGEKAIIPVTTWPKVLNLADKQIVNPSVTDCVKAGYRLLPSKPATPEGKQIKTETVIQDDKNPAMVKYVLTYEDAPPAPKITVVESDKVEFVFVGDEFQNVRLKK